MAMSLNPTYITRTTLQHGRKSATLCPLHISRSDARCCRVGQCEWVPDPASAAGASLGDHWEVVGQSGAERVQCNCLSEGVVINRTPSPCQPTQMYALRAIWPMWMGSRPDVGWFCPDLPLTTSEASRGVRSANVKWALCPLHTSQMPSEVNRDKAIRRRVGTPFTLAEWRAMRTFTLVGTVKDSYSL